MGSTRHERCRCSLHDRRRPHTGRDGSFLLDLSLRLHPAKPLDGGPVLVANYVLRFCSVVRLQLAAKNEAYALARESIHFDGIALWTAFPGLLGFSFTVLYFVIRDILPVDIGFFLLILRPPAITCQGFIEFMVPPKY